MQIYSFCEGMIELLIKLYKYCVATFNVFFFVAVLGLNQFEVSSEIRGANKYFMLSSDNSLNRCLHASSMCLGPPKITLLLSGSYWTAVPRTNTELIGLTIDTCFIPYCIRD